jgi:hypothetical protein
MDTKNVKTAKSLNLAAGIIDIVLSAILLGGIISLILLFNELYGLIGGYVYDILIIALVLNIIEFSVYLIFGIVTLVFRARNGDAYVAKKGTFLTFAIVETILLCFILYGVISNPTVFNFIYLFLSIGLVTVRYIGFAYLVKANNYQEELRSNEATIKNVAPPSQPQPEIRVENTTPVKENKESDPHEVITKKLQSLNQLKKDGLITDEEFEELKKKIISNI